MVQTIIRVLLLTLVWGALQGTFGGGTLLLGAVFAVGVLALTQPLYDREESVQRGGLQALRVFALRFWWSIVLLLVFLRELTQSAISVAVATIRPRLDIRPGIIAYPLDVQTEREITALANLISLTPGTLSLDVSPDQAYLYVHAMSVTTEDGQDVIREIKTSLEEYVHRALGPRV